MLNLVSLLVFSSHRKAMWNNALESYVKQCTEGMINSLNTDFTVRHGNKLKKSRWYILENMTKPKTKCVIDFSMCRHDTKEGFQEESDLTYLKKLHRDGLQKAGKAHSLRNKNCMTCCTPLLPSHKGGDINWLWYVFEICAFDGGGMFDHSQRLISALPWCARMWWIVWVNDRSLWSGFYDFSVLSWESVDVMFVLTINSSFQWGLKIVGVLPLRCVVSGCTPTYQPKVASKFTGCLP
jgi:hypothetical protein